MDDKRTPSPDYELYAYAPSLPGNAALTAVFCLLTGSHLILYCLRRDNMFIPLLVGGILEIIGTACRTLGHFEEYAIAPYAIQSIFILVAPTLLAATIYVGLGRVITATRMENALPFPTRMLTLSFVLGDITSFLVQSTGGGLQAKAEQDSVIAGLYTAIGGLAIQVILLIAFIWISLLARGRILRSAASNRPGDMGHPGARILLLVAMASLILVRSIIRIAEFVQGENGYLLVCEWPLLVLDLAFMAVLMLAMGFWYVPNGESRGREKEASVERSTRAVTHV